jgi:hypothetical protein
MQLNDVREQFLRTFGEAGFRHSPPLLRTVFNAPSIEELAREIDARTL